MNQVFAANVLAWYRALQCVRARYREAGRKPPRMHEQRRDADAHLWNVCYAGDASGLSFSTTKVLMMTVFLGPFLLPACGVSTGI
jgi:hypothetical protein